MTSTRDSRRPPSRQSITPTVIATGSLYFCRQAGLWRRRSEALTQRNSCLLAAPRSCACRSRYLVGMQPRRAGSPIAWDQNIAGDCRHAPHCLAQNPIPLASRTRCHFAARRLAWRLLLPTLRHMPRNLQRITRSQSDSPCLRCIELASTAIRRLALAHCVWNRRAVPAVRSPVSLSKGGRSAAYGSTSSPRTESEQRFQMHPRHNVATRNALIEP